MTKDNLIDNIVREVMYRIEGAENDEERTEGTVVLLTSYVPGYRKAMERISSAFGEDATYIGFDGANLPEGLHVKTVNAKEQGYESVLDTVSQKKHIVLLSPSLTLLDDIANARDERPIAYVIIRSLLWGKDVNVLLDFEPPRFKRNTLYEKTADIIGALEDAGIRVMTYKAVTDPEADMLQLVTESDILEAYKSGMIAIKKAPGAIVTPSAKDASRQLSIRID